MKIRKFISKILCCALVTTMLMPVGNVLEKKQVITDVYADVTIEESSVEEFTTELESTTPETTTPETTTPETTTLEPTTPETTTPAPTTQETTTPAPTTEQPTTKKSTEVEPWGKNQKGQFVNGKKKVIKGATMKGIDVSHYQGKINWKKVSKSDVDYAIIRCGYGDNFKSQDDKYWEANVAGCEKYNIPYGVYIYSYATTVKQAKVKQHMY